MSYPEVEQRQREFEAQVAVVQQLTLDLEVELKRLVDMGISLNPVFEKQYEQRLFHTVALVVPHIERYWRGNVEQFVIGVRPVVKE